MDKEKILETMSQVEELFSKLKSEILEVNKEKFQVVPLLKITTHNNKNTLLEKMRKVKINFQNYPLIKNSDPVLIKSLYVLDISKNELGIEELTVAQISILMPYLNKLKQESRHAIIKALDRNKEFVNIRKISAKKIFYSIIEKGCHHYRNIGN